MSVSKTSVLPRFIRDSFNRANNFDKHQYDHSTNDDDSVIFDGAAYLIDIKNKANSDLISIKVDSKQREIQKIPFDYI